MTAGRAAGRQLVIEAMQLARGGRQDEAVSLIEQVLAQRPEQADALQLLGLIRRQQGELSAAEALLRRSLAANPNQPHVFNNLGNVLSDRGHPQAAIDCYRSACSLKPDYAEARLNLGITLLASGHAESALLETDSVIATHPEDVKARVTRGNALKHLGRYDEAEQAWRQALALDPKQVNALHNLGVLCKQQGRVREALVLIEAAARLSPERAEIHYNRGHALLAADRIDDAINAYGIAIRLEPENPAPHDSLNKVMWQHGRNDGYLSSYAWAVRRRPRATALRLDWADKLILAGRSHEAVVVLEEAIAAGLATADIHHRLARALSVAGRVEEAEARFNSALAMRPRNTRYLMDLGRLQIVQSRYAAALQNLDAALAVTSDDQEAIAYQGVCWRLLEDPRERVLNDYKRYIREFRLLPPAGYPSIEAFNLQLLHSLEQLHRTTRAPAEQTLRGGTQTLDGLFETGVPEVEDLRRLIEAAVAEYVDGIDGEVWHPLVRRRSGAFTFSGSWSVRLHSNGFHVNHVHSQGWISSCYYVSVPDCVADESARQGWLRFGETNLYLGERERTGRMIKPEEGLLVLFPSCFFHGTVPFNSGQQRVTVAFDVVPK